MALPRDCNHDYIATWVASQCVADPVIDITTMMLCIMILINSRHSRVRCPEGFFTMQISTGCMEEMLQVTETAVAHYYYNGVHLGSYLRDRSSKF